jgi:hypothetical protein
MTANAPTQRFQNNKEPIAKGINPVNIWDNDNLNLSKGGQFMKVIILICLLIPGCIVYPDPEMMINQALTTAVSPAQPLTEPLAGSQIYASQLNQLVSGLAGPNQVSAGLLEYQNYNRAVNNAIQNPWEAVLNNRALWLH